MASPTRYKKGDYKAVCDVCGQRYLMSKLRKRWDGLMVCHKDFEPRQPQDFVRAKVDIQAVPVTRPESIEYNFLPIDWGKQFYESVIILGTAGSQYIDPSYFAEDYLFNGNSQNSEVSIVVGYNRVLSDTSTTSSTLSWTLVKGLVDGTSNSDAFILDSEKVLGDTVVSGDSGNIVSQDYIDATYFLEDYVGISVTF